MVGKGRVMVFKYGPIEPEDRGLGLRDLLIKYAPPAPRKPPPPIITIKPEESLDKETKALLKQIAKCLKEIENLLRKIGLLTTFQQDKEKSNIKELTDELNACLGELALLYAKLDDLQKPGKKQTKTTPAPDKKKRDIIIMYIVMTPR